MQTKTVVDALHQYAADLRLTVQDHNILTTGIVCRHSCSHTGRTAANNDYIMIYHLIHRSFLSPYGSYRQTW